MAHFGKTGERLLEFEVVLVAFVGEFVEFGFVCFQVFDEVNEVAGLLELFKVLGVNHVAELVFNPDHKFNCVE